MLSSATTRPLVSPSTAPPSATLLIPQAERAGGVAALSESNAGFSQRPSIIRPPDIALPPVTLQRDSISPAQPGAEHPLTPETAVRSIQDVLDTGLVSQGELLTYLGDACEIITLGNTDIVVASIENDAYP